ncbi:hypothetical protein [Actinophytocola sp.]|uniref:hypothetical protein n=1 Tax=Actinophytocola sp. TaxID=1872138 RepID=UPI00389A8241
MAAAWGDAPTGGLSECAALVRSAEALRTSAPELSVQLARRALLIGATDISSSTTNAGEARTLSMRAQAVLAAGLVRISQHVGAVEPGFAALALAESGGALVLAAELRLDLASCAQEVGEPLLGGALLRPVLEATQAPPSVRAAALGCLVGCLAHAARRDDIEDALAEADRLLAADDGMSPDARRMERARLAVRSAAYHRWYGDNEDAVSAARDGLVLLERLHRALRPESDRLRARLVLELVCALLDEGELYEAAQAARPTVDEPVRATSAESVGQLMLAVATRVHLPAGDVDRGRGLVDQAAWLAERHHLDSLLADALTELSRLDEQAGRTKEALEAMRSARAAEQRRMRAVARAARHLLVQVGAGQGVRDVTRQSVAALLRQLAHPAGVPVAMAPPPVPQTTSTLPPPRTSSEPHTPPMAGEVSGSVAERTGLLNREDLVKRLRSVRKGERPVALTLVRFEPNNDDPEQDRGPDTGIMVGLADKVRDMAPENAELARSDGGELAVFMPHTTRDQAEEFAATIRETATKSDWLADGTGKDLSISTSVVQSDPPTPDTESPMDPAVMLTAARDALTSGKQQPAPQDFLVETKAALSNLRQQTSTPPQPPSAVEPTPSAEPPPSALTDEPPTRPLTATRPPAAAPPLTAGRSILNSLSIPTGSGGRRRADDEPFTDESPHSPAAPPEPPRLTRAERRAQEQAAAEQTAQGQPSSYIPSSGWPAEPDISQALRRTPPEPRPPTEPTPSPSTTHSAGSATHSADSATRSAGSATRSADSATHAAGSATDPVGSATRVAGSGTHSAGSVAPLISNALSTVLSNTVDTTMGASPSPGPTESVDWPGNVVPGGTGPSTGADLVEGAGRIGSAGLESRPDLMATAGPTEGPEPTSDAGTPAPLGRTDGFPPPGESASTAQPDSSWTSGTGSIDWTASAAGTDLHQPGTGLDGNSSYEETRAELARMMSALNAKALHSRGKANTDTPTPEQHGTPHPTDPTHHDDFLAQTIPTPPDPDEMPQPPGHPDIPEIPDYPDIPTVPGHPDIPEPPQHPGTPEPSAPTQPKLPPEPAPPTEPEAPKPWPEPFTRADPLTHPEQLTHPDPFTHPEPRTEPEPLTHPEPLAYPEPLGEWGPLTYPAPFAQPQSRAEPETPAPRGPRAQPESHAERSMRTEPEFPAPLEPLAHPEPQTRRELLTPPESRPWPEASTRPEPLSYPEPFSQPDPPYRTEVPEPSAPAQAAPPAQPESSRWPDEPAEPQPERLPRERSSLMAAFDALSGPVLPSPEDEQEKFRTEFESPTALPSRRPRKSWTELQSAAVIESPADDLFGSPGDRPKHRANLRDAFADFGDPPATKPEPPAATKPEPPSPTRNEPSTTASNEPPTAAPTARNEPSTAARDEVPTSRWNEAPATRDDSSIAGWSELPAAWSDPAAGRSEHTAGRSESAAARNEAPGARGEPSITPWSEQTVGRGESAAGRSELAATRNEAPGVRDEPSIAAWSEQTVGWSESAAGRSEPAAARNEAPGVRDEPSITPWSKQTGGRSESAAGRSEPTAARNEVSATLGEWSTRPSVAESAPSGASARPTYDEPIGPLPRPHGRLRRGERSATTIASLLTEALAAYQSSTDAAETAGNTATTDEQDEPGRLSGDAATAAGRHRSPE